MKINFLILACLLAIILTGCGNNKNNYESFNQANCGGLSYPVMETDTGYYYNSSEYHLALQYYDKETGKSVYLCNKPECSHDGNQFCAATLETSHVVNYMAMYDGYIYICIDEADDTNHQIKLLRAALDGTELTEVATIKKYAGNAGVFDMHFDTDKYMVFYENKAYVPYNIEQNDGARNHGLAIVDLNKGSVDYWEEISDKDYQGYSHLIPNNKYIYYSIKGSLFSSNEGETTLYRYNIEDDSVEEIVADESLHGYCIADDKILYSLTDDDGLYHIWSLDPDNTTSEDITGAIESVSEENDFDEFGGHLIYHNGYVFICTNSYANSGEDDCFYVFNTEGELLTSFNAPCESGFQEMSIIGENIYFRNIAKIVRCPLNDVLENNIEWETIISVSFDE